MNLNLNYCPICNHKLEYHYYNFENIGDYYCSHCKFQRPNSQYTVTEIQYAKSNIVINETTKIHLSFNVLYAIYNTLAAYTTATLLELEPSNIATAVSNYHQNTKIFDIKTYHDRIVTILNNKNENSSTFNQSLLYVSRFKEPKTIIIGWKEISRRYHYDDLSWLYDIDFELLKKLNIEKIICVGIHCYDIATRLKYADIEEKKIIPFENLEEGTNYIKKKTKGNIYAILNFDYVIPFRNFMKEGEKE